MLVGGTHALAVLLAVAAVSKMKSPLRAAAAMADTGLPSGTAVVRALAIAELVLAGLVLFVGGPLPALGLAACYLGFAGFIVRLRQVTGNRGGCGCFGAEDTPAGRLHAVFNLAAASLAAAAAFAGAPSLVTEASRQPLWALPYLALVGLLASGMLLTLTSVPALLEAQRLVERAQPGASAPRRAAGAGSPAPPPPVQLRTGPAQHRSGTPASALPGDPR